MGTLLKAGLIYLAVIDQKDLPDIKLGIVLYALKLPYDLFFKIILHPKLHKVCDGKDTRKP